ncbi:bifunctional cobalt-precorrin-7 (C(5))-methyltransferase/cobalt-precorrin-6B (C(15))-methyltransferase [Geobacillus stearothermophilus]|uniref:bifunctional cobalt-precorrin-7 (C(5))-methyltransferase/cobalt-precorrin-6B (C(15))-methyltransferase n=1 Tax=Geobacillus stearothermophilus TaxID=1422 RepID=UPI0005194617|nr:bifunctional cobalt-precorrin-7 (C(5))-methyltransferase/cobalt-precorrin-6B (C(15))-methyltransferase [Geobacillus stearothermophilus]KOR94982.1 cobalamin biosynthesis protein CbiE [Geobacillus stearothermophilus ATCC 12980]MED3663504.1 bifunctional cobalt-precorrin-7 (C(5))-methyltransferase/cobalt-precorrin-6B (C(15))-methyltransferase [Geobacillus stearothermophilus]MED3731161.1 bifunctional cobalt-precorrin-7 (C(5))-methyltransferase/cobalt-precorrin-6B (C(15))-methyltransferase [Geobaci
MGTMKLIGVGADGKASLPELYRRWIDESELLVGGERQLAMFPEYKGETIVIRRGLAELVERLRHETRRTVVLASGDPLFYGIGSYLASKLSIEVYPAISSVQWAFAKMGESWQDAAFVSAHGRPLTGLVQRIDGRRKVAILTDETNSPAVIARYLLEYGMTEYEAFVGEELGGPNERCRLFSLEEMAEAEFLPLNIVILRQTAPSPVWPFGIEDDEFFQRKPDKGLITKKEIRVLSLSALRLRPDSVVWDIGTCTGSVAIEAAKIARDGAVFAIEKNEQDIELCRQNLRKFRVDITLVHGRAPDRLDEFADPDAIFIGGTSGAMSPLLDVCAKRLKKNGRIVINAATVETLAEAGRELRSRGFHVDITLAQVSRSKPILELTRFEALNPVYIMTAKREGDE